MTHPSWSMSTRHSVNAAMAGLCVLLRWLTVGMPHISSQDGVVCKLAYDEFAPAIPGNDTPLFGNSEGVPCICPRRAYGGEETTCNCVTEVLLAWVSQKMSSASVVSVQFAKLTSTPLRYQLDCFSRFQLQRGCLRRLLCTGSPIFHQHYEGLMLSSPLSTGWASLCGLCPALLP